MALQDIHTTLKRGTPHRMCATCHALATMTDDDAATLRGLLADRAVRFKDLAAAMALDDDTPTIDWQALSRHARGECSAKERLRS